MTDPTKKRDDEPRVVQGVALTSLGSVQPTTHVANMTPDGPQPIKDHRDVLAEHEAAARKYLADQAAEYAVWEATEDIQTVDGVPIYRPGMRVPVSNVRLHGYDKQGVVRRVPQQPEEKPGEKL